jgi:predicted NBD/HSP70 family sugar kinase
VRYLGIDVHVQATVWCLLDSSGTIIERGKTPTTSPALTSLVHRLSAEEELLVGQEVGRLCQFVHDTVTRVDHAGHRASLGGPASGSLQVRTCPRQPLRAECDLKP